MKQAEQAALLRAKDSKPPVKEPPSADPATRGIRARNERCAQVEIQLNSQGRTLSCCTTPLSFSSSP